jgi:ribosome-binding factor A
MKTYKRVKRVAPLVQSILSDLIRHRVQDPRLRKGAITSVEMKDDLRLATVFFQVTPGADSNEVLTGFEQARTFLRRELGRQLAMKYIPDLRFIYDDRHEHVERVEEILQRLKSE